MQGMMKNTPGPFVENIDEEANITMRNFEIVLKWGVISTQPLAPLVKRRPSLKITALSYSWTHFNSNSVSSWISALTAVFWFSSLQSSWPRSSNPRVRVSFTMTTRSVQDNPVMCFFKYILCFLDPSSVDQREGISNDHLDYSIWPDRVFL